MESFTITTPVRDAGPDGPAPLAPERGGGTATLARPVTETSEEMSTDDGSADRFSHYVSKDKMERSRRTGRPVVALCGKVWVPRHDPSKYPVCPECKKIYDQMRGMGS